MSEQKLPDIVERLRAKADDIAHQVRGQDPGDWKEIGLMREAASEIERLRSPAPAEDGEGLREALRLAQVELRRTRPNVYGALHAISAALSSGRDGASPKGKGVGK